MASQPQWVTEEVKRQVSKWQGGCSDNCQQVGNSGCGEREIHRRRRTELDLRLAGPAHS